jgi:hypothetical protein
MKLRKLSMPQVTLLEAISDVNLFRPFFRDMRTWQAWRVVLKSIFGLPLSRLTGDYKLYTKLTGRAAVPTEQCNEAWFVIGRRGGKSFICALIAVYLACFRDYRPFLSPGERATIMVLACDRRQSRTVMRYVQALLELPMLQRLIVRVGVESIELSNRVVIEVHTSSYRSIRGYTVAAAILDELAFWRSEESANPDTEIIAALKPAMATIPGALLLGISSPYARRGALWEAYDQHYGREGDPVLVFQAESRLMNPTLSADTIEQAHRDDPANAAAEFGAEFRSDIEGFLQPEWISGAVSEGVHELPSVPGIARTAFTDPSGGSNDSFTLAIAHNENGRLILDVCRSRRPPFDPQKVTAEYSLLLKQYGLARVTGDRYSAEWVVSAFRANGIYYEVSQRSASEIYLEALPRFATGAIQLLDNRALLTELRQLERFTGAGRDRVDHPPRGHDDLAVAACGALLLAVQSVPLDLTQAFIPDAADRRATHTALAEHLAVDLGYSAGDEKEDYPFTGDSNDF